MPLCWAWEQKQSQTSWTNALRDRDHSMALLSTTLGTNEKTDERESEMPFAEDVSKIDEMEKDEKTDQKEPEMVLDQDFLNTNEMEPQRWRVKTDEAGSELPV